MFKEYLLYYLVKVIPGTSPVVVKGSRDPSIRSQWPHLYFYQHYTGLFCVMYLALQHVHGHWSEVLYL